MSNTTLQNKKIAMVIAHHDFRDEELFIPRSIFVGEGAEVKTISSKKQAKALGVYGGTVNVDLTLEELVVSDFDGIIFVGGAGAQKYIEDERCWQIAREAAGKNKVLGAICIAPAILARSGVLKNKKATVWHSALDKSMVKLLKEEKVAYEDKSVVVDKKFVTANGPAAARKFAEAIVRALQSF